MEDVIRIGTISAVDTVNGTARVYYPDRGATSAPLQLFAFRTTRRGLSNYIAWAVPPICQTGAHWLLLGYPPQSLGMPLVSAGVCLVAAAAAQVLNERQEYENRGGGKGKR